MWQIGSWTTFEQVYIFHFLLICQSFGWTNFKILSMECVMVTDLTVYCLYKILSKKKCLECLFLFTILFGATQRTGAKEMNWVTLERLQGTKDLCSHKGLHKSRRVDDFVSYFRKEMKGAFFQLMCVCTNTTLQHGMKST